MDQNEGFGALWEMWPNKIKKAEARKVFREMESQGRLPPTGALLAAAERYAAATKGRYKRQICQLATWLRGERFEDELDVAIYKPVYYQNGKTLAQLMKEYLNGTRPKYQHAPHYCNDDSSRRQTISDGPDAQQHPIHSADGPEGGCRPDD